MEINYANTISVKDYNHLRVSVGWPPVEEGQAQIGIDNSNFITAAVVDGQAVGTVRVVGDGGYIVVIVDVMVLPEYQGYGIGKEMMNRVMEFINSSLKKDQFVFVNLMALKDRESFYTQFGFQIRPNEETGAGMTQYIYHNDDR